MMEVIIQLLPLMTTKAARAVMRTVGILQKSTIMPWHNCLAMRMKKSSSCCLNRGQFPIGMQTIWHTCAVWKNARKKKELSTIKPELVRIKALWLSLAISHLLS